MSAMSNGNDEQYTRAVLRNADAICFDVDSTVCRDEAIDELAKFAGKEKEVQDLTKLAMRGGCSFYEALIHRLDLIQPTVQMMEAYLRTHPPRFTPGIKELVSLLQSRGVDVYLVSGGFRTLIQPVAKELGVPQSHIFANHLKFYYDGSYAGFDDKEFTCQQDGKARVIDYLRQKHGYKSIVMVGDGSTDLAAYPPADAFIGFGGNQIRDKIKKESPWFVLSFFDVMDSLNSN